MPTVTVSSRISDAVYFVAIIGLSILLARPVQGVFTASQQKGAEIVSAGLAEMVNSMTPGMTVAAPLQSYPGVGLSVSLSGTTITASFGGEVATAHVKWSLQPATLAEGETYLFTLRGGEVFVKQNGHS